jgi:hypothetical protein
LKIKRRNVFVVQKKNMHAVSLAPHAVCCTFCAYQSRFAYDFWLS